MAPIEFHTQDKLEYTWFPTEGAGVVFRVRAANDAHLALSSQNAETTPMLEVFLGGWGNAKSVIRKNRTKPEVAEQSTPGILSATEYKGFWIRWTGNLIDVGREGEAAAFLSYHNNEAFPIRYIGICTGWGATGSWIIDAPHTAPSNAGFTSFGAGGGAVPMSAYTSASPSAVWVPAVAGVIPGGAFVGGEDNGEGLVVGRAHHEGALLPGKVVPSHKVCYVAWGGGEHGKSEYEVLVGSGHWVPGAGSNIPPNALPAGETEEGEPLFVGRAQHEGTVTIGKVQPSHGVCYISYAGQEMGFDRFEVLVV